MLTIAIDAPPLQAVPVVDTWQLGTTVAVTRIEDVLVPDARALEAKATASSNAPLKPQVKSRASAAISLPPEPE